MLIVKGIYPRFLLWGGSHRSGHILLHDEDGADWPSASGLVVPSFNRLGQPLEDSGAQRYYGDGYKLHRGSVKLPPLQLSKWKKIGKVKEALYTRRGDLAVTPDSPGSRKGHKFGEPSGLFSSKGELPTLYKLGKHLRLELPSGVTWNWRGLIG